MVPTGGDGWIAPRRYEDQPSAAAMDQMAEAAHIRLRFKLPDGDVSELLDTVVMNDVFANAQAPQGDFAFATAVAAYGQILRADEMMMGFSHEDVGQLAGQQSSVWRQEFLLLNARAGEMAGKANNGG